MSRLLSRHAILPALFAAALALPAAAEDAHHPPTDTAKPPATQPSQPAQPRAAQPGMPGGMMMGNMMQMMQMMHQMMSGMMQNQDAMHRMRMMGMGGMGNAGSMGQMQAGAPAVASVEGHIAFLKAELKITAAQGKAWDDFAAALRTNAKQLNELAAELGKAPAATTPVERIALQEKVQAARLEIVRRTKVTLAALYTTLSDDQKKTFGEHAAPRMGTER